MHQSKDYVQQLADYILKNLKKGYTLDALRFSLIEQGYSRISVEKAIEIVNQRLAKTAPKMKEKPQITYKVSPEPEEFIKKSFWKKVSSLFN